MTRAAAAAMGYKDIEISLLCQVDPWSWAYYNNLQLLGSRYTVQGHEYQVAPLQCAARRQCAKKATQRGWTEVEVIKALHGLRYARYPRGVMYIFPTADEVTNFSKSRFRPFLANNMDAIGRYVADTDAVDIKQIGDSFLHFRGARLNQTIEGMQKTSSKLKSTPVDKVVFDELDEMDQDAIELALARMQHSEVKEESYLANPTVPDFGIDALYQKSDQRVWMIECRHCGRETCLDLEFPNCFKRQLDGSVIRACKSCGREIYPSDGYWIAQYPSRSADLVGWWDSQLGSIYTSPQQLLDEYENPETNEVRFNNLKLGKAFIKAEDRLTKNDVYLCCGNDAMAMTSPGPNAMGVDVGYNPLHVIVGQRIAKSGGKILKACRVGTFQDVWDIGVRYGVKSVVFDLHPEMHKVREFCAAAPYSAFGCVYSEFQKGVAAWDEKSKTVTVNRTEICDASHKMVTTVGRLELPRRDAEIDIVAEQCNNTAKVLEENKVTGGMIYRYRKLGPDHYRHAMNYWMLALSRVPAVSRSGNIEPQGVDFYYG